MLILLFGINMLKSLLLLLSHGFDTCIAYFRLEGLTLQWVQTTSWLKRANLQQQRKFRQALMLDSYVGVE